MLFCFCGANGQPTIARKAVCGWWFREQGLLLASYEARKFGVRSATSGVMAKKYCQRLFLLSQGLIGIKKFQARFKRFFYEYTTWWNHSRLMRLI
jgi:DNA polymerase-4